MVDRTLKSNYCYYYFNPELSPMGYSPGPKLQEVGEEGELGSDGRHFDVFINCEGQSHTTVSTDHNILKREESRSGIKSRSLCLQA